MSLVRLRNGTPVDFDSVQDWLDFIYAMRTGSPIANPGFETWSGGTSFTNPANGASTVTSWLYSKYGTSSASANVARESTLFDSGAYSCKVTITVAGSADSYIEVGQEVPTVSRFAGKTVVFGVKVMASNASKVHAVIWNGSVDIVSDFHTGDGEWQNLQVTTTLSGSIAEIDPYVAINSDFTGSVYIDSAYLYVVDPLMSATARAALVYDPLVSVI